eukprot:1773325-Rhodomonas_salina.4
MHAVGTANAQSTRTNCACGMSREHIHDVAGGNQTRLPQLKKTRMLELRARPFPCTAMVRIRAAQRVGIAIRRNSLEQA